MTHLRTSRVGRVVLGQQVLPYTGLLFLALLIVGAASLAAQTTVDFESLVVDGSAIGNHTGLSDGADIASGANVFQYTVNGSLKYVTPPGALYIGYRRSTPTTEFRISKSVGTFVPDALTFSNPFYLIGGLELQLIGYQGATNVWSKNVSVGSTLVWENVTVDLKPLAPPAVTSLAITPVTPSDLYTYLEGWAYISSVDDDGDGVFDDYDQCLDTPGGETVDADGCGPSQLDDDGDLVSNADDQCPGTPSGATVNGVGCAYSQLDQDNDGVSNGDDQCPNTSSGQNVDGQGCSTAQQDANGNGIADGIEAAILLIILNGSTVEEE